MVGCERRRRRPATYGGKGANRRADQPQLNHHDDTRGPNQTDGQTNSTTTARQRAPNKPKFTTKKTKSNHLGLVPPLAHDVALGAPLPAGDRVGAALLLVGVVVARALLRVVVQPARALGRALVGEW